MTSVESQVSSDFYKILRRAEINTVLIQSNKIFQKSLGYIWNKSSFCDKYREHWLVYGIWISEI